MILSKTGEIVNSFWQEIPRHFANAILDEFMVMPNHLHGIIVLKNDSRPAAGSVGAGDATGTVGANNGSDGNVMGAHDVDANGICRDVALQRLYNPDHNNPDPRIIHRPDNPHKNQFMSGISPESKSLPIIIRSFKSICTRIIREKFPAMYFQWQERFYDHVIRDKTAHYQIQEYIRNNPMNWDKDRNSSAVIYPFFPSRACLMDYESVFTTNRHGERMQCRPQGRGGEGWASDAARAQLILSDSFNLNLSLNYQILFFY